MEDTEIDLPEEDREAVEKYRRLILDITRIKELIDQYKERNDSLKDITYADLLKRLSYYKNKQFSTRKKIRALYKRIYKD